MAFPTTPILDNFNRADSGTLGSNWTISGDVDLAISSNQAAPSSAAAFNNDYYNVKTFLNCEAYVTVNVKPTNGDLMGLQARFQSGGETYYLEIISDAGTDTWALGYFDGISSGFELDSGTQEITNGDSFGIACIGSSIQAWYKSGAGAWTLLSSKEDTTLTADGFLGLYAEPAADTNIRFDNFGGGNAVNMQSSMLLGVGL